MLTGVDTKYEEKTISLVSADINRLDAEATTNTACTNRAEKLSEAMGEVPDTIFCCFAG